MLFISDGRDLFVKHEYIDIEEQAHYATARVSRGKGE
jgi:hypothetical protein